MKTRRNVVFNVIKRVTSTVRNVCARMPNDWQDKTFKIYESTQSCIVRNQQLITRPLFPTHHSGELSERDQLWGTDDENRVTVLTVYYPQTAACSMKLYILEHLMQTV